MRTRQWIASGATVFAIIAASIASQAQTSTEQLLGTWQIVSFKATSGDQVSYPLGDQPKGYMEFTGRRFWLMLFNSTRKPPAGSALTDADAGALMKTHAAYTGTYEVDPAQTPEGIRITVNVDAAPNEALNGTKRVFFTRVDGNKLTLTSPAIVVPTTGLKSVVHLELVKTK